MTDLQHFERQLSRLRDQLAVLGAASPTAAELADQDAADHAMAQRIRTARPGLPLHHVYITLQALRAVQELDQPGSPEPINVDNPRNTGWYWTCTTCGAGSGKFSTDDTARAQAAIEHPQCPPDPEGPYAWTVSTATEATETPDPSHGLSVQHADALWDAVAPPGPDRPPYTVQYERVCRATAGILREQPFQTVQGRCPACGNSLLFLGEGGHVTCSLDECPNPSAADELLRRTGQTQELTP